MTADQSAAADTLRDELATISNPATRQRLLNAAFRYADAQVAAALAAVRALLDPDAEMATWVAGHRYFEEADIRRALDGVQP